MKKLFELRKKENFTQSQMAKILNVSQQAYARYEKGEREPDFDTLIRIANYFCVTLDYLLGRTNEKTTTITAPIFLDIEKLKQIKKEKGFTFKEISSLSGVPLRTIEDMFAGRTKPRIDTVEAIEKALGITRSNALSTPANNVIEHRTFDIKDDEKALIITLRRSGNGSAYIRAMLTMLGEERSIEEILKRA